ncbi:hypothetical protein AAGT13_00860, partial [Azotobacter salinestris]
MIALACCEFCFGKYFSDRPARACFMHESPGVSQVSMFKQLFTGSKEAANNLNRILYGRHPLL